MTLLDIQRDFRRWLTLEAVPSEDRFGPNAAAGLAVYLNNYRTALMSCLSESFAVTKAWLGESAFLAAAANHVDWQPPHSWTLDDYALEFPETLAALYPGDREVAELASLERALGTAFVGPDAVPLDPASLTGMDWDNAVFTFVPTLVFLTANTNAGAIWSAIIAGEQLPGAGWLASPATIAVWREGLTSAFRTLDADEADALQYLHAGKSFGQLCNRLVERLGEQDGIAGSAAYLARWLGDRLIVGAASNTGELEDAKRHPGSSHAEWLGDTQ